MTRYQASRKLTLAILSALVFLLIAAGAAHEVYVLPSEAINESMSTTSPDPFTALQGQQLLFVAFILGILLTGIAVFYISVSARFEEAYAPLLKQLKPYAPYVLQATLGFGLIASATTQQLFGPELPLHIITDDIQVLSLILYLAGLLLVFNLETRISGMLAILVYAVGFQHFGTYLLHYAGYLGLALFVVLREEHPALDEFLAALFKTPILPARWIDHPNKPYLILRILYGGAIIYAAVYAKYLYSNLALATIEHHALTQYLPFEPMVIVLAALFIELAVGAAFILGIEVRFAVILLLLFNVVSFLVFNEALWPHIWIVGTAVAIFLHGYDKYTVEGYLTRKQEHEPLL